MKKNEFASGLYNRIKFSQIIFKIKHKYIPNRFAKLDLHM